MKNNLGIPIHRPITKVVHCKRSNFDVYIGRPSKWGNPFTHHPDASTLAQFTVNDRTDAIEHYKEWITAGDGMHLLKDLDELKGKTLGCWCKPLGCHGDVLAELANKQNVIDRFNQMSKK